MFKKVKNKIKNSVLQLGNSNLSIFKSKNVTVNQVQAIDQLKAYLINGDTDNAVNLIGMMKNFMDSQHPAAPYYKYDFGINENGQKYISHIPAFPGAEKLAPLKGKMTITIPTKYKRFKNMKEILNYSYGAQEEIEFDLQSLKTWVGDTILEEFEGNESGKIKIIPSEFPTPSPMKLYLKDNSWSIDYLLVGVSRIENNVVTLNNHKQLEAPIAIELFMDLENTTANFNITITDCGLHSVKTLLKFNELIEKSKSENKASLALKLLEKDTDLFTGVNWNFNDNDSASRQDLLDYLKKLYFIEQELNVEFKFPERLVMEWEIHIIDIIYQTLKNEVLDIPFTRSYFFEVTNKQDIQRLLINEQENELLNVSLTLKSTEPFELFGVKFISKSNEVFIKNVKIEKPERLWKKSNLLDEGESLRVTLIPAGPDSTINEKLTVEPIV